jgi:hypothetical protein
MDNEALTSAPLVTVRVAGEKVQAACAGKLAQLRVRVPEYPVPGTICRE